MRKNKKVSPYLVSIKESVSRNYLVYSSSSKAAETKALKMAGNSRKKLNKYSICDIDSVETSNLDDPMTMYKEFKRV